MEQLAHKSTPVSHSERRDPSNTAERGGDKPTRRRSHRPRGCRGGSNRRKNKGGENKNSLNKPKRGLTKKQGSFKNQRSSFNKGSKASTLNALSVVGSHAPANMGRHMGVHEYDQAPSLQEYGYGAQPGDMYYSPNSSSSSGTDLQESLSESSEDCIPNPNSRSFHLDPHDGGLILPPLASTNLQEPEPVKFRGPNPYALHQSNIHNISYPRLPVYGMHNNNNNHHGNIAQIPDGDDTKQFYCHGNGYSENPAHADVLALNLPGLESKMAQLSKQQPPRPVRSGGSLFCTSPRSFLMGTTKDHSTTRSE
ncbi:unnamed protein product [Cylindrotheca closterium]|uniref:Uncharacterized protein n=1 Tax=Cylindrotheca closterium TaxID=2856 RepID=A0AAD2CUK3_9STRA|nr:unnamed protein product [Cylindrotheca closterium]